MDDILLLEQIIEFYLKPDHEAKKSCMNKFEDRHYATVLKVALKKYHDESIAKNHVNTSFGLFFVAITQFGFPKENFIKSLTVLALLPHYQTTLANEFVEYLEHKESDYISTEKELKSNVLYLFQRLSPKFFVRVFTDNQSKNLKEEGLSFDWVYKSAFEIYMHFALGKKAEISMVQIHRMVEESFYLFVLRYSTNALLIKSVQGKVNESIHAGVGWLRPYKELQNETSSILSLSAERFLKKIHEPDFILKTSIVEYVKKFFRYINKELYNGTTTEERKQRKDKIRKAMYENLPFEIEEAFEFMKEAVEAKKHLKNGHALQLLVSGRNMNFVIILKEAYGLQDINVKNVEETLLEHYGNQESINEQRKDCKIEVINWMKSQVKDRSSYWYGQKGEQILNFIRNNKPV